MSFIPIASLLTPIPATTFRQQMVQNLVTMGVPADQWAAGGVFSTILTVVSIILGSLSTLLATVTNGFFLPTATGQGLVLLAQYMYGVTAPTATFASGTATFTNTSGASYSKPAGSVSISNPNSPTAGLTYTNTQTLTLGAVGSPTASATVNIQATVIGSAGNASPATITNIVSPTMPGVTVSNAASVVGLDAPSDATVRQLCLNSLGVRSVRGVRTAYGFAVQVATNSVTGLPVNINRWSISNNSHTGTVTVVVAAPGGAPTSTDVAGVVTSIENNARPQAITVNTVGASVSADTNQMTVWASFPTMTTIAQVQAAIAAALVTLYQNYPIGGVTADDDANPGGFTGLLADAKVGVIAGAVQSLGGTLISVQGATDLSLTSTEVAGNSLPTPIVRMLPPPGLS